MEASENFRLEQHLGTGGFAQTWRAKVLCEELVDEFGLEEVALKIPLTKQKQRTLKRELELNASLWRHIRDELASANVVRYIGFDWFQGSTVIAFEFMPDGNLRKRMGSAMRRRRIEAREAARLTAEVLRGLAIIHGERILHRDIKPENILFFGDVPKVADLGIGRMLRANELASSVAGTTPYMSPEILDHEGELSSDIWSIGVMFYEMLTPQLPFGDDNTHIGTLVDHIRARSYKPAIEVCADIPPQLSSIIDDIFRAEAAARPSAAALRERLLEHSGVGGGELDREMNSIREMMVGNCSSVEFHQAEGRLTGIIAKMPKYTKAYQYLGELYNLCQRCEEAVAVFRKGLTVAPDDVMLHWDLGHAYLQTARKVKARREFGKVAEMASDAAMRRHAEVLMKSIDRSTAGTREQSKDKGRPSK
jgi:serine/threonine protein kinase